MFIKTIEAVVKANWPMIAIFLVTMISLRLFYIKNHRERISLYKEFLNIIAIIYIFLLFLLLTQVELNSNSGFNIVPFTEIMRYKFGSKLFMYNVVGNILLFIPFGFFVADYVKSKNIGPAFIISLLVSTSVEFIQLQIGRSFDVDDIILNVLGSIVGYLLYIGLVAIKNHLPKIFQKDGLYNLLCLLIIVLILLYILKVTGVLVF